MRKSLEEIGDHFNRRRLESTRPKGLIVTTQVNALGATNAVLSPTSAMSSFIERFPPLWFHGHVAVDGAVRLHTFPDHANPYGGISHEQLTTSVTNFEWSDLATSHLSTEKLNVWARTALGLGRDEQSQTEFAFSLNLLLRWSWTTMSSKCVLAIATISQCALSLASKRSQGSSTNEPIRHLIDNWWSESKTPFKLRLYRITSAPTVSYLSLDPETNRRYLVLTLP